MLKSVLSNKELLDLVVQISENNLADEVLNSDMYYKDNAEEKNMEQSYLYSERLRHKNKRNKQI